MDLHCKKDQDEIIKNLRVIQDQMSIFDRWDEIYSCKSQLIVRILACYMFNLYSELGITCKKKDFSRHLDKITEDNVYDNISELEYVINSFVFPEDDEDFSFMTQYGWDITEIDQDEYFYYEKEEDISESENNIEDEDRFDKMTNFIKDEYGLLGELFMDSIRTILDSADDDWYLSHCFIYRNKKLGKFYEYCLQHVNEVDLMLKDNIDFCKDVISVPLYFYYTFACDENIKDGCYYAISCMGEVSEGEIISVIHGKLHRRLCVILLDILLDEANEKYHFY